VKNNIPHLILQYNASVNNTELSTAMGIDVSGWANKDTSRWKLYVKFWDRNSFTAYSRLNKDKKVLVLSRKQLVNYYTKDNKDLHFKNQYLLCYLI